MINKNYKKALKDAADAYRIAKGYHGGAHPETLFALKNLLKCKAAFDENVQQPEPEVTANVPFENEEKSDSNDSWSPFWSGQQRGTYSTVMPSLPSVNEISSAEQHENTEEAEEKRKVDNDVDYDQLMGHRG